MARIVSINEPEKRAYQVEYDRIGEVFLTGQSDDIDVHVRTSHPVVYAYTSEAKIHDRRHPQVAYAWWFPHRPAMTANDPAAGHIDGDTLRVTLGSDHKPAVFEVMQSCGCGHLVYVSERVEQLARREFGEPKPEDVLAVQRKTGNPHGLIVMGTIAVPSEEPRPWVAIVPGYHSVLGVMCKDGLRIEDKGVVQRVAYDLADYEQLERLPLGDRQASMFGADGLVHKAGRQEGWLLAPTGILSAGQPRKRGTQRIRWDEYKFDDPHLLENALRLPQAF